MTNARFKVSWTEANQTCLVAEFTRLKQRLESKSQSYVDEAVEELRAAMDEPPAIDSLAGYFDLSGFERDVLLLAAGVEMDSALAYLCSQLADGRQRAPLTFGVAMAALAEPHWSALTPARPLRRFRLVDIEPGHGLTSAPLRIDERILHYLAGLNQPDGRLQAIVQILPSPDGLSEGHKDVVGQILRVLETGAPQMPLFHLCGDDPQGQEDVSALVAAETGRQLFTLRAEDLPPAGPELDQLLVLWERESLLLPAALLIQCASSGLTAATRHAMERLPGLLIVASSEPIRSSRTFLRFDVDKPRPDEQKHLWEAALGDRAAGANGSLGRLSQQFRLSARMIRSAGALVGSGDGQLAPEDLWGMCRSFARPKLEHLAQRLVPAADWKVLVLPQPQLDTLHHLAAQVRNRMTVYETWGFSANGRRGLGVSALFSGESGTGKTLAAEVLAHDLALDLYRIDLSAVVSKYIGETEKNLKQVFDAAEEGGALLLFDEADALFGKRGEVKDSHDRYANIEVGYLLQRMEEYQGLAILTTNLKSSMDRAFQRRLRFTVHFPFPDAEQREDIWRRIFPALTPTEDLDHRKLAQLKVAGGNIRNIALNAAFLAAESKHAVTMEHLLRAAELEAHKVERPLSEAEIRGWV
jgi:hypothetical protein